MLNRVLGAALTFNGDAGRQPVIPQGQGVMKVTFV